MLSQFICYEGEYFYIHTSNSSKQFNVRGETKKDELECYKEWKNQTIYSEVLE